MATKYSRDDVQRLILAEAHRQGVPPRLALAVARQESGFNPQAHSKAGALGVMQLMPATARDLGVDPRDTPQNIQGGVTYLQQQLQRFGGDTTKALAAYNAGPGAVQKYGGVPPFKETRGYVRRIMATLGAGTAEAATVPNLPDLPETPPDLPERPTPQASAAEVPDLPELPNAPTGQRESPQAQQTRETVGMLPGFEFMGFLPQQAQQRVIEGAPAVAATGINVAGELGGSAIGTAVGGPGVGTAVGSMVGSLAARRANVALGLEEPGLGGDVLAVAPGIVTGALQGFKTILRGTAGARQLQRTEALSTAQTAAATGRAELQGVQEQIGQIAGETARGQQQLTSQAAGLRQAARGGLQARVEATEALGERLTGGAQAGLQSRVERLGAVQARLQTAGQARLGQVTGPQVDALVRQMANTGKDVSDSAIHLAYQQIEQYAGTRLPRRRLDTALAAIAPAVRRGLREVLSVIPGVPKGTPAQSIANTMTFEQLRGVQRQVGQNIRVLERQVALGSDVAAPQRLAALKRVYAATFDTLDDAVELARLPAEAKIALQEANTLNRVAATFDRVDTLREVHGTRTVGGEIVFDAQNLRTAIRKDGFLVKQLTNLGIYDGLDATLGRIAVAQRGKLPAPGTVKVAPLRLGDRPTFESLPLAQRQAAREGVMQRTGRQARVQGAQARVRAKRQTVDEQLAATLEDIDQRLPDVAPGVPLGRATAGIAGIMSLGLATGRTGTAAAVSTTLAGLQGISHYLLTAQGQRLLERVLSHDPTLGLARMRLLVAAGRSGSGAQPSASVPQAGN